MSQSEPFTLIVVVSILNLIKIFFDLSFCICSLILNLSSFSFPVFSGIVTDFFEPLKPKQDLVGLAHEHKSIFLQGSNLNCMLKYFCILLLVLR